MVAKAIAKGTGLDPVRQRPQDIIRATGARVTQPRLQVLTLLQEARHALSHMDVWEAVSARAAANEADRVTIYRVLDWLVSEGIAHRLAGQDRVWRFVLNETAEASGEHKLHEHAHFVCLDCGKTQCLDEAPKHFHPVLPAGYRFDSLEVNVKGHCADCTEPLMRPSMRTSRPASIAEQATASKSNLNSAEKSSKVPVPAQGPIKPKAAQLRPR